MRLTAKVQAKVERHEWPHFAAFSAWFAALACRPLFRGPIAAPQRFARWPEFFFPLFLPKYLGAISGEQANVQWAEGCSSER